MTVLWKPKVPGGPETQSCFLTFGGTGFSVTIDSLHRQELQLLSDFGIPILRPSIPLISPIPESN